MVVGNGMIARRFAEYEQDESHIIFASGVSNSGNKSEEFFLRERQLLEKMIVENSEKKLVYFSTCSIYDASMHDSPYVQHKLAMEELIKKHSNQFCIFRVSNPVGFTANPNTVLNYFVQHITAQKPFEIWVNASRNLIDLDDMYALCNYLLSNSLVDNRYINIANPGNYSVCNIVAAIERHLKIKGNYKLIDKGNSPQINISNLVQMFQQLQLNFNDTYLNRLLKKYY